MTDEEEEFEFRRRAEAEQGGKRRSPVEMKAEGADATEGMSGWDKFVAGYGKAGSDLVRGAGNLGRDVLEALPGAGGEQTLSSQITGKLNKGWGARFADFMGLPTGAEMAESKMRDAPLVDSGAGMAGNIVGNVAAAAPTAFLPGANTVLGAALYGGGFGAVQPADGWQQRGTNAMESAGMSGGVTAAARALPAAYRALVSPFTAGGQENIALSTLGRFAKDKDTVKNALVQELVPGSKPTLAEATGDPGIAQLQRAAAARSPEVASMMAENRTGKVTARKNALLDIAGSPDDRLMFHEARRATADDLYGKAYKKGIDITRNPETGQFKPAAEIRGIKGEITKLMKRPAIQDAVKEARRIAANEGVKMSDMTGSVKGLDYMKRALDDKISVAVRGGNNNEARVLGDLKDRLLTTIDGLSPDYKAARTAFAEMSKPINRAEVGSYLYDKLVPALSDLGAERMSPQAFARALKEGDAMAAKATGFSGAKLADVLTNDDMNMIINIGKDLGREVAAGERGKVLGSPTAQYLAGANLLRQVIGPLGLPEKWVEKTIGETISSWGSKFPFNIAEDKIQNKIGQFLANPSAAKDAAGRQAASAAKMVPLSDVAKFALPPAAIGGSAYATQQ